MRLLGPLHPLYGMQHDFLSPKFKIDKLDSNTKDYMVDIVDKGVPDLDGDAALREEIYARHIAPPRDGEFLRMTIPTLQGKLALVEGLKFEEMGIAVANVSPQIFALCQLYNCFLQVGLVQGTWPELETVMEWHRGRIFMCITPDKPDLFWSRMLSASGFSASAIKKAQDLNQEPDHDFDSGKNTHKTCELEPSPPTKILRDYVHGKDTGLKTWYRLCEEMSKEPGTSSSRTQENGGLNILSFNKMLHHSEQLRQLLPRLEFDYTGLTLQCNVICHKIDIAHEPPGTKLLSSGVKLLKMRYIRSHPLSEAAKSCPWSLVRQTASILPRSRRARRRRMRRSPPFL
jgi:hypothetical protein